MEATHEFHLSKSTVNYDSASNSIQVSMHIFIDDLEVALDVQGTKNLRIGTGKEADDADTYISRYIEKQVQFFQGKDTLEQEFLGKELSADLAAIWCYIEIPINGQLQELTVDNRLLMEVYDDQKNIISVKKDKKRVKDWLFDIDDHSETTAF